mgnify:CR=1 FL=1
MDYKVKLRGIITFEGTIEDAEDLRDALATAIYEAENGAAVIEWTEKNIE